VRSPKHADKASNNKDFPAPVSPVRTLKPCSISKAKWLASAKLIKVKWVSINASNAQIVLLKDREFL
jgi:hypothetical protein